MLLNSLIHGVAVLAFISIVFLTRITINHFCARIRLRHIAGPQSSSMIWGEEWLLYRNAPGSLYVKWHKQFGKVVKFSGAFGVLSITDPRAITFIVGEAIYNFPKPRGVRAWFKATLGEGILWVEGKTAHERQRRALAPAFSQQCIRDLTSIFYLTSAKMAAQWMKQIEASPTDEVEIEATNWAGRFALDTVGLAAFSYDFNCLSGEPHALAQTLDGLTNNENKLSSFYMRALFWVFPSILLIGKKGEMIRQSKRELGKIASNMWKDAKAAGDTEGRNLMAFMLRADAVSREDVDEEHVVAQMRTVLSAGYETVSAVVAWMLYELAVNPCLQHNLREEISTPGEPSFDNLNQKYPLLDAALKETIRLHPPILENHHEAIETISVPLSEPLPGRSEMQLVIPKGTIISIPVNVVQNDPEMWGPDAHIFRPERWLERKENSRLNGREIFAFSEGPRACIGRAFALAEIKALIIVLLRQFSFTCPHEIEAFQSFVIRPCIKGQGPSSLPLLVRKI